MLREALRLCDGPADVREPCETSRAGQERSVPERAWVGSFASAGEWIQPTDVCDSRWKLAELPIVNEFLILLRGKIIDEVEDFKKPLLTAVELCCSV